VKLLARPLYNFGAAAIVFAAGLAHAAYLAPELYRFWGSAHNGWWAVFAAVQLVVGYGIGLPDQARSRVGAAVRGFAASTVAFVAISIFQGLLATPLLPRSSLVLIALIHPLWTVIAWNLANDASAWAATRARVFAVVERPEDVDGLRSEVSDGGELPAAIVGAVTLDEVRAAGTRPLVVERARAAGATILVIDAAGQAYPPLVEQAAELHRAGLRIRTLSLFYEEWLGKLPHAELARVSLLFDVGELHRARYVRAKRAVDLVFAVVGAVALVPIAAAIATLNLGWNRGPLVFRQARVGRHGTEFVIYKFRTMRPEPAGVPGSGGRPAGADDGVWTVEGDARVTPLGRLLRKAHVDELPQVVNILRGDLSLVGPRPEQPRYVEELSEKIAFYDVRHIVRPGLTGWAQVKQGYAADHDDAFEKLQYDFYYLRRQGLALDAKIIRRTIEGVLRGDGR
jgi:lipopolysaccharide/colanic/teichoic acid biosynthesis glycosyltransferase